MKRTNKNSKFIFLPHDFTSINYTQESTAYKAIHGYILQVEEMNGKYVIEYLPPEYAEEYKNNINATLEVK